MNSLKKVFQQLEKGKKAIGHFNVSNLETFEAAVMASKKTKTPIIIGASEGAIKHAGLDFFIWAKEYFQEKYATQIFIHIDHGKDLDLLESAIRKGFDSVMIDASAEKFQQNVYLTKYIVKIARKYGVWVESEIGSVGGAEEKNNNRGLIYTDPIQAEEFVKKTACNSLAVSIGTSHGAYKFKGESRLNFQILKQIKNLVDIPLVLHGASGVSGEVTRGLKKIGINLGRTSGVSDANIKEAIKLGIRKVNIDTDLQLAMFLQLVKEVKKGDETKLYKILNNVAEAMGEEVIGKIKLFSGR
ncbi:MAG TPA: class II fructose-bisphosphate aldolase [Patescibacteria group bacterium]|nr:class II fructose-bisphosphate aldolase [Patescibacteria group bacterium]